MNFLKKIKNSVYDPNYYTELLAKPFSYSLKYFLLLSLTLSIITVAILSFSTIPKLSTSLNTLGQKILLYYPTELEITVKNGKASANVSQPYFIKTPSEWQTDVKTKNSDIENILVIDTQTPFSIESFKRYKTACLLNQTSLTCYDNKNIKITQLSPTFNMVLNKNVVSSFVEKCQPYLRFAFPFFLVIFFIAFFFLNTGHLFYLLFGALIIWLVAKIRKIKMNYKLSYRLGMHLMTAPILFSLLLEQVLGIPLHIPFLFTAILIGITIANLKPQTPQTISEQLEARQNVVSDIPSTQSQKESA